MTPEETAKALRDLAFLQIHAANLIDSQAAQITALKEIAIAERANAIQNNPNRTVEVSRKRAIELACQQLATEHPEEMR